MFDLKYFDFVKVVGESADQRSKVAAVTPGLCAPEVGPD